MGMANDLLPPEVDSAPTKPSWFVRPLSGWACLLGWCVASGVFVGCVAVPGGPAVGDAFLIIYPTWAVAHGQFVCMYPPHPLSIATFTPPVYPLIAGGIGYVTRIGHGASFPSGTALGHNCAKAVVAMVHWSMRGGAVWPTLRTGYVVWLFLMVGVILLLRASGRGRSGWEPTALVIVAALPPVWLCIEEYAHPQDVVAMGFALAVMACALRAKWVAAGVLIALAVLTQQYALLVAIPLLVVAPAARRIPFALSALATAALIAVPLILLTSGSATRPIFAGSGTSGGLGGTVAWELHVRNGAPLLLVSRIPPLVLAFVLSWYVVRRLGQSALQPAVLVSLVAVSLSFRLVFEDNIFSYYFMALAVMLVLLDVVRGRIRETLVAWLAMVTLVYTEPYIIIWRQSWDETARHWIPVIVMAAGLILIVRAVLRHAVGWNVVMWAAAVVTALFFWPVSSDPLPHQPVTWLWQVILVGIGVALAAGPLSALLRQYSAVPESHDEPIPSVPLG